MFKIEKSTRKYYFVYRGHIHLTYVFFNTSGVIRIQIGATVPQYRKVD